MAIFDNADGPRDGNLAGSGHFEEAADDYDHYYGSHHWPDIIQQLRAHVALHGTIDELVIFDHGVGGGQSFGGDVALDSARLAQLQALMSTNGVVIFGGCCVGSNPTYCHDAAQVIGRPVIASTSSVYFIPDGTMWGHDFYAGSPGTWQVFGGILNPSDYGLYVRTVAAPSDGGAGVAQPVDGSFWGVYLGEYNGGPKYYQLSTDSNHHGGRNVVTLTVR